MLVAHLSDPHLRTGPLAAEPAAGLYRSLQRVLALDPRPDCVIVTGDLCEFGHPGAYADLEVLLRRFPLPVHLTTGNHDDRDALLETFGGTRFLGDTTSTRYVVEYPAATIVVLDSKHGDRPGGLLGDDQLGWLDAALALRPETPAFVCLHHPPVAVGIPFLDGMRLDDGAAMGEVVGRHANVVGVLAGHVHRIICAPFAGTSVAVAPSTYRQTDLCLRADRMIGYVAEPTGYLLHVLDGSHCVTHAVTASHAGALLGAF